MYYRAGEVPHKVPEGWRDFENFFYICWSLEKFVFVNSKIVFAEDLSECSATYIVYHHVYTIPQIKS